MSRKMRIDVERVPRCTLCNSEVEIPGYHWEGVDKYGNPSYLCSRCMTLSYDDPITEDSKNIPICDVCYEDMIEDGSETYVLRKRWGLGVCSRCLSKGGVY